MEKMYDLAQAEASATARQRGFELEKMREAGRGGKGKEKENVLEHREEKGGFSWFKVAMAALSAALVAILLFMDGEQWTKIKKFLLDDLVPAMKKLWTDYVKPIGILFKDHILKSWESLKKLFTGLKESFALFSEGKWWEGIKTFFSSIGTYLGEALDNMVTLVYNTIATIFGMSKTDSVYGSISKFFTDLYDDFIFWINVTWFNITTTIKDTFQGIVDWFGSLFGNVKDTLVNLVKDSLTMLTNFGNWVYGKTIGPVVEWFGTLFVNVKDGLVNLAKDSLAMLTNFGDWIYTKAIAPIVEWFKTLFSDPKAALIILAKNYLSMFTDFGGWIYKKAIAPIVNWIGTLFGAKEGETSKGIEHWVGDKLKKITNFAEEIYNKYIDPIVKWVAKLFGGGDEKGGSSGIKWPDLSAMMPDLPTWDNIKGRIGNLLNDMIQGLASMMDISFLGGVSESVSDLGIKIASGLGVTSAQKYNPKSEKIETVGLDAETGRVLTKKELDARTKAAEDAKAAAAKSAAGGTVVVAPTNAPTFNAGARTNIAQTIDAKGPKTPR
jgi:hypothetical protein